jgi:hypothetical protein
VKIIKQICFLLGMAVLGALLFYAYAVAADTGYFIRWERWGGLSEGGIKILTPDVVVTISGQVYQHMPFCKDHCWQEVENPTISSTHSLPLKECGWMPDASHQVESMIRCESYGPGGTATRILAIDQKGDIYSWEHYKGEGGIILIMIAPYLGGFLGFLIGIIILVVYWVINRLHQRRVEG